MNFSQKLYDLRKKNKISQKDLAEKLSVSQASINYWEKGQRRPSAEAVGKIADFFCVSTDYLMGIDDSEDNDNIKIVKAKIYGTPSRINNIIKMGNLMDILNDSGQEKAIEQIELLTLIPEYKDDKYVTSIKKIADQEKVKEAAETLKYILTETSPSDHDPEFVKEIQDFLKSAKEKRKQAGIDEFENKDTHTAINDSETE